ncbi:MAG: hypothetical protein U9N40_00685 [Euryarchaeota archaeon]|nr:hypothetical protein [Euryarchaeota archaeon]
MTGNEPGSFVLLGAVLHYLIFVSGIILNLKGMKKNLILFGISFCHNREPV